MQRKPSGVSRLRRAEGLGLVIGDYGSPPPAAAAAHLTSASMVPDFSPLLELT